MRFFPMLRCGTLGLIKREVDGHSAARHIKSGSGYAQQAAGFAFDRLHTRRRRLAKHSRAVPAIEQQQSAIAKVDARRAQGRDDILVFELVSDDREHHQGHIKFSIAAEITNVADGEFELSFWALRLGRLTYPPLFPPCKGGRCFDTPKTHFSRGALAGFGNHVQRSINAKNVMTAIGERDCVAPCTAAEIENIEGRGRNSTMICDDSLNEIAFGLVVFVGVERVIDAGIKFSERLFREWR